MSTHQEHGPTTFLTRYVFSTDHKVIGVQFTFVALLFVILGGLLALGVRYQIAWPNQNVPYAKLLPGKMTALAPEANLALWKRGCEVQLKAGVTIRGQQVPPGSKAVLVGFPEGLAVSIPPGTIVRNAEGQRRTLVEAVPAFIDDEQVMADYDYAKQEALTVVGVSVTVPSSAGGSPQRWELLGLQRRVLDAVGQPRVETHEGQLRLPIRAQDTPVTIRVDGLTARAMAGDMRFDKEALTSDAYLQLFTMHASIMIFLVIIPMLVGGFGNFLIPLMVGARDMAFPRLNMLSFWLAAPAGAIMVLSFWVRNGPAGGGWTMYPPLSELGWVKPELGTTLWVVAVGMVGFSSVVGALNYITTILNMRAPGMTMFRMPLTVWSLLITSILALFATPVLTAAMVLLLLDRTMGTHFFLPGQGGQPLLWQHLFWFYSHPAVYIMILPAMGVTSDILACHARKPIFGYQPMIYAMAAITGLGFVVWGHHMFQSGMNPVLGTTFMVSTIMIAVPSAIKTFNWLGTLWGGTIRFTPAMLNALGFVSMFVIGGLSGIFMASAPVDIPLHDTYFIVAHIHYVLFGGSMFAIFAGIYHWFPKMFGKQLDQRWGVIHFITTFIAFNGTFFVMHIFGIGGAPRRYASYMEYPTLMHLQPLNVVMTISAMMLGMAQIPFFFNLFASLPRRLARAVVAVFAIMLGLPTVAGLSWWAATEGGTSWLATLVASQADGGAWRYTAQADWVGYVALALGWFVLTVLLLGQLPRGGKIASALVMAVVAWMAYWAMTVGGSLYDAQGRLVEAMAWAKVFHDVAVALGHGTVFAVIAITVVWTMWAVGGAIRARALCGGLLHIVWLPAFLMPLVLKQDTYLWLGVPGQFVSRWWLLAVLLVPGLAYLLVVRPRDAYGFEPGTNPWQANSLEWATSSPPPPLNFDQIPTVYRGPYEYNSPVVEDDYLPQVRVLPVGIVEPVGH